MAGPEHATSLDYKQPITMNKYIYSAVFALVPLIQSAHAQQTQYVWGAKTNDVRMSIMVKDESYFISADSIVDLSKLIDRLRRHLDPPCLFLWQSLSDGDQEVLMKYQPWPQGAKQAEDIIVKAFNRIIGGSNTYSFEQFKDVKLRRETRNFIEYLSLAKLGGPQAYLNRLILEDVFPAELARNPSAANPIIKSGDAVVLMIVFTNMSTNETFYVPTADSIENDKRYLFNVVTPSGRTLYPKGDFTLVFSQLSYALDTVENRQLAFSFNLSGICQFDEVGNYTVTGLRQVDWPEGKQAQFWVISNPLNIRIVPAK
jgi:hypothetical protein